MVFPWFSHGLTFGQEEDTAFGRFGEFTQALQVKVTAGHGRLRLQLFEDQTQNQLLGQVGTVLVEMAMAEKRYRALVICVLCIYI